MRRIVKKRRKTQSKKTRKKPPIAAAWRKLQKQWRRAKKRILRKKNRPKIALAIGVLLAVTLLWLFYDSRPNNSRYYSTRSQNKSRTNATSTNSAGQRSVKKRHDSVFYNNAAPKVEGSRQQNYSSAFGE